MRAAVLAAVLGSLSVVPAAAQTRRGFWMEGGVGFGRLRVTDSSGVVGRANGTTMTVAFGGSTEQHVLLGVEGQLWSGASGGPHQRVGSVTVIAQWYPLHGAGLFLRGGTGIVHGRVARADTSSTLATVSGTGVGLTVGAGAGGDAHQRARGPGPAGCDLLRHHRVRVPTRHSGDAAVTQRGSPKNRCAALETRRAQPDVGARPGSRELGAHQGGVG